MDQKVETDCCESISERMRQHVCSSDRSFQMRPRDREGRKLRSSHQGRSTRRDYEEEMITKELSLKRDFMKNERIAKGESREGRGGELRV